MLIFRTFVFYCYFVLGAKTIVEVVVVTVLDPVTAGDAATQGREAGIGALEAGELILFSNSPSLFVIRIKYLLSFEQFNKYVFDLFLSKILIVGAVTVGVTGQDPVTAMTVVTGQDLDPGTADDQDPRIVAAVAATKAAARNGEDYIQQNLIYCFGTIIQL